MFWYNLPQKWGRVGTNFGQKFQIFKSFIIPKIQAQFNEYGSEGKKFYYIFNLTFDRVNIPIQSVVNDQTPPPKRADVILECSLIYRHTYANIVLFKTNQTSYTTSTSTLWALV